MSIIGVVSMKGGVGKTSITANLAAAMAAVLGRGRVSVVDLDPQNSTHWHFGLDGRSSSGVCMQSISGVPWARSFIPSDYGVSCMPYGEVSESDRETFEDLLAAEPNWVGLQLQRAGLGDDSVVFVDTPPGPSVYLRQVFECADLVLIVLLADAGSYATVPAMESWLREMKSLSSQPKCMYVLNQVDRTDPLNRDVTALLQKHLGARLIPIHIHRDEAVGEALAFRQPVMTYGPHGQASHDLARLAKWVIETLNQ